MKIICFGDSNTYGYDPRSYFGDRYAAEYRWVNILEERLGCTAVNAGENGREIPHCRWQIAEVIRMLEEESPFDLLLVMLGTNDLLQGNPVTDIVKRMETFLCETEVGTDRILLIAPPVLRLGEWVASRKLVEASIDLNKAYKKLAESLCVRFVDAGEWNLNLTFDGVHLTQEAHRIFSDGLLYYLRKGE
jgi:lysophospholipase L1-like esterase